jgi:hypothetical protein
MYRTVCRSNWPGGLRRRSAAVRLVELCVRIPPVGIDVCCDCCVLSGGGVCGRLITRPGSPTDCGMCVCVCVCDRETSTKRRTWKIVAVVWWKEKKLYLYCFWWIWHGLYQKNAVILTDCVNTVLLRMVHYIVSTYCWCYWQRAVAKLTVTVFLYELKSGSWL